jgi:hypothetical protein
VVMNRVRRLDSILNDSLSYSLVGAVVFN